MTPEERAEQLVQLIARGDAAFDKRGWIEMPKADRNRYITRSSEHLEAIAQAIREAEDAAYERGKAEYIESVRNCILIDKERYAEMRRRRITGFDESAPYPSEPEPEAFILKS